MAKKKFGLRSTLKKNKTPETSLPKKITLPKTERDLDVIKDKVEAIHDEKKEVVLPTPKPAAPKAPRKSTTRTTKKKVEIVEPVEVVRLSIDVPKAIHKKMKVKTVGLDTTIRNYVLNLIKKDMGL